MRRVFGALHRWAGLFIAGFLVVSGLTGAVISWDHELDGLLNPHLVYAPETAHPIAPLEIARDIEARYPEAQVIGIPLAVEPGHAYVFDVDSRVDPATGELYYLGFNQVFVDPGTGRELGKRDWGVAWPITRENFVSFLYVLHYSLHLPEFAGIDHWGVWLLGVVALIWTLDCFTGFALTLPRRRRTNGDVSADEPLPRGKTWWQRWKPAWLIRLGAGGYKLNFDLHRAFSLWTWLVLFIVAFTGFSLNLYDEMFQPAMSMVSDVTPTPYDEREPRTRNDPIEPNLSFPQTLERGRQEARRLGWEAPPGDIYYSRDYGIYYVAFYRPEEGHGAGGVGHRYMNIDALDGRVLSTHLPWNGTAADIFLQAQFPLHSGRILGLPGRILISVMGLVVAMLSITGVIIWLRKRRAQRMERVPRQIPETA